jgi:hypothetical protein
MFPVPTVNDCNDRAFADAVVARQGGHDFAFGASPSNLAHRRFCQLGAMMTFAEVRPLVAAFQVSIGRICGVRPQEQVLGIDAMAHVAAVANRHSWRNWPDVNLIRETVCPVILVAVGKFPVSSAILPADPWPAPRRLLDKAPEMLNDGAPPSVRPNFLSTHTACSLDAMQYAVLTADRLECLARLDLLAAVTGGGKKDGLHRALLQPYLLYRYLTI